MLKTTFTIIKKNTKNMSGPAPEEDSMDSNIFDIVAVVVLIAAAGGYLVWRYTSKKSSGCGCGCDGCDSASSSKSLDNRGGGCGGCGGC